MTNRLIQLIPERIGFVTSEFDRKDLTPEHLHKLKGVKGRNNSAESMVWCCGTCCDSL